jgi:hypothetical protein
LTTELLRANEGKQVTLGIEGKDLNAKVIDVLEANGVRPPLPGDVGAEVELALRGAELVALETSDGKRLVIPISSVHTLAGNALGTQCIQQREIATRTKRLTFDFGPSAAGKAVSLRLLYFTGGVRWIPTYRVGTGTGKKAELELQAEILNEEEDFDAASVDLVVGVPSFKFNDTISPMSLEQTLRTTLAQAMPQLMNNSNSFSNASFNLRSGESGNSEGANVKLLAMASKLGGETKQDFFVYPVKNLGLTKGARAVIPLWKHQVPQRHLYTVELSNWSGPNKNGLVENKVMHELELTNDTDVPFTTGAAMFMEGLLPLGQDVLGYTSPTGKTLLPMTTALNLRAVQSEVEVERINNALVVDNNHYALVKQKGSVALANLQKLPATFRVTLTIAGKVDRVSNGGIITPHDLEHDRVNGQSQVVWEVMLSPGQKQNLTYDFNIFR